MKKRREAKPMVRTTVQFPATMHRLLARLAEKRGISLNSLIVELCEHAKDGKPRE